MVCENHSPHMPLGIMKFITMCYGRVAIVIGIVFGKVRQLSWISLVDSYRRLHEDAERQCLSQYWMINDSTAQIKQALPAEGRIHESTRLVSPWFVLICHRLDH
jgi:hypothetical protein